MNGGVILWFHSGTGVELLLEYGLCFYIFRWQGIVFEANWLSENADITNFKREMLPIYKI